MKSKTIKMILAKRIGEWIKSLPEGMREQVKRDTIVTGGSIVSMLMKEKVNDYDIYFKTVETARLIADHYVQQFVNANGSWRETKVEVIDGRVRIKIQSSGKLEDESLETQEENRTAEALEQGITSLDEIPAEESKEKVFKPVFISSNAITLTDKIQIVVRFTGDANTIHENYDFVHCTCWWTASDNKLELSAIALESILSKELRYIGSKYPICSLFRVRKFVQRGWTINAGQILKMCLQVNSLKLDDINVLEDQLVGVDATYFNMLIGELREQQKKDSKFVYNSGYLMTMIDRIF